MFKFFKRRKIEKFSSDELKEQMIRYSEEYINHIEKMSEQPRLDYNIGNLEILEISLKQAHEMKDELSDDKKFWIVSRVSAYISEIARTNFGGKYHWNKNLNQPLLTIGEPDYKIHLLALDKVNGRIENGIEDNVSFFFYGFIAHLKDAEKGDEKFII